MAKKRGNQKASINPQDYVEGVAALNKALDDLPLKMQKHVVGAVTRAGARVIQKDAKRRVHKRRGILKKSIVVKKVSKTLRREGWKGDYVVGFKQPGSRIAHLEEFGTSHSPAHPFMRPAMTENDGAILKAMSVAGLKAFQKNAAKLTGSAAASGLLRRKGFIYKRLK